MAFLKKIERLWLKFKIWAEVNIRILLIKTIRFFSQAKIPQAADGKLNLHLGCGKISHPKFINIDVYPYPYVHYVQGIDRLDRFTDSTVDLIYASHCLEHFKYTHTLIVLKEWNRVLKKGGILRLAVPDFDKLIFIYSDNNNDPDAILPQLMGGQENKYNFHLTALSRVNLSKLLSEAGFSHVRDWIPGSNDLSSFDDMSIYQKEINGKSYEVSLHIEAEK